MTEGKKLCLSGTMLIILQNIRIKSSVDVSASLSVHRHLFSLGEDRIKRADKSFDVHL